MGQTLNPDWTSLDDWPPPQFKDSYLAKRSMFPDCSSTSQTQATCSCVNPNEVMPPAPEGGGRGGGGTAAEAVLAADTAAAAAAAAAIPDTSVDGYSVSAEAVVDGDGLPNPPTTDDDVVDVVVDAVAAAADDGYCPQTWASEEKLVMPAAAASCMSAAAADCRRELAAKAAEVSVLLLSPGVAVDCDELGVVSGMTWL